MLGLLLSNLFFSQTPHKKGSRLLDQFTPTRGTSLADIEKWEHNVLSQDINVVRSPAKVNMFFVTFNEPAQANVT